MPASGADTSLIMPRFFNGYFPLTIGTVSALCAFPDIVVEDIILRDSHFIDPFIPVLRKFRCLGKLQIPWIRLALMLAPQLLMPDAQLIFQNTCITTLLCTKKGHNGLMPLLTDPFTLRVGYIRRPADHVQLCSEPFFLIPVVGNKVMIFLSI